MDSARTRCIICCPRVLVITDGPASPGLNSDRQRPMSVIILNKSSERYRETRSIVFGKRSIVCHFDLTRVNTLLKSMTVI